MATIPSPFVPRGAPVGAAGGDLSGTYPNPTVTASHLSAALPVNQGGTGSTTQNFVDLTSAQTVGGVKTFSGGVTVSNGVGQDLYAVKPSTTSRASTTTPTDDPDLTVTVAANAVYFVFLVIGYTPTSSGAGIKYGWTYPTGCTMQWTDNDGAGQAITGTNILVADDGTGPMGLLQVGGTAGAFTLRWAQNTSNATATNLLLGSSLYLRRLA